MKKLLSLALLCSSVIYSSEKFTDFLKEAEWTEDDVKNELKYIEYKTIKPSSITYAQRFEMFFLRKECQKSITCDNYNTCLRVLNGIEHSIKILDDYGIRQESKPTLEKLHDIRVNVTIQLDEAVSRCEEKVKTKKNYNEFGRLIKKVVIKKNK